MSEKVCCEAISRTPPPTQKGAWLDTRTDCRAVRHRIQAVSALRTGHKTESRPHVAGKTCRRIRLGNSRITFPNVSPKSSPASKKSGGQQPKLREMILVKLFSGRFVFKNVASLRLSRRGDNVGFFRRRCRRQRATIIGNPCSSNRPAPVASGFGL